MSYCPLEPNSAMKSVVFIQVYRTLGKPRLLIWLVNICEVYKFLLFFWWDFQLVIWTRYFSSPAFNERMRTQNTYYRGLGEKIHKSSFICTADLFLLRWPLPSPPTYSQQLNLIAQLQIANKLKLRGRYNLNKHSSFKVHPCDIYYMCLAQWEWKRIQFMMGTLLLIQ